MSYIEYIKNMPREQLEEALMHARFKLWRLQNLAVDDQSVHFWHLQLQFMAMEKLSEAAYNTLYGIYFSPIYKPNNFTRKIRNLMFLKGHSFWNDEDFNCLCTHFALQLSGIEE